MNSEIVNKVPEIRTLYIRRYNKKLIEALDELTKRGFKNGIARNNYYMFDTDSIIRFDRRYPALEFVLKCIGLAAEFEHKYLMIIKAYDK